MRKNILLISASILFALSSCGNNQSTITSSTSNSRSSSQSTSVAPEPEKRSDRVRKAFRDLPIIYLRTVNTFIEHDTTTNLEFDDFGVFYEDNGMTISGVGEFSLSKQNEDEELYCGYKEYIEEAILQASVQDGSTKYTVSKVFYDGAVNFYSKDGNSYLDLSNGNLISTLVDVISEASKASKEDVLAELKKYIGDYFKVGTYSTFLKKLDPSAVQETADIFDANLRAIDYSLFDNEQFAFFDYALRFLYNDGKIDFNLNLNKVDLYAIALVTAETDEDIKAITKTFDEYRKMSIGISIKTNDFKVVDEISLSLDIEQNDGINIFGDISCKLDVDVFSVVMPESYDEYLMY